MITINTDKNEDKITIMAKSNPPKFKPSDEQKAILESKGDTMVVSNPGTGKTTTLSLKVIDLLENGAKPEDILCITFTTKAKKENDW